MNDNDQFFMSKECFAWGFGLSAVLWVLVIGVVQVVS